VPLGRLGREQEHGWLVALAASPMGVRRAPPEQEPRRAVVHGSLSGSVITLDGARDNWFGPWPPPSLVSAEGEAPTEARHQGA
jgi:citronellol/citronellal dehydrogenase